MQTENLPEWTEADRISDRMLKVELAISACLTSILEAKLKNP